jgi:hypothetical protein
MAPHQWVFCFLTNFLQILISTTEGIFCQKFPGFRKTRHQISTVEKGSKICRISFKQYIYIYIWQLLSIFNIFQRIMDYIKPEVLITPATLKIQSPEKQKNTTLNPLGILMLLWVDGPLSTATETHTQQYKGDFRVFVARKDLTVRLCAETMLQLKPQTKPQHMLFVCPYASTEISYSP